MYYPYPLILTNKYNHELIIKESKLFYHMVRIIIIKCISLIKYLTFLNIDIISYIFYFFIKK